MNCSRILFLSLPRRYFHLDVRSGGFLHRRCSDCGSHVHCMLQQEKKVRILCVCVCVGGGGV